MRRERGKIWAEFVKSRLSEINLAQANCLKIPLWPLNSCHVDLIPWRSWISRKRAGRELRAIPKVSLWTNLAWARWTRVSELASDFEPLLERTGSEMESEIPFALCNAHFNYLVILMSFRIYIIYNWRDL
jgi:hypothetical protein